jgi:hypothetical protein
MDGPSNRFEAEAWDPLIEARGADREHSNSHTPAHTLAVAALV